MIERKNVSVSLTPELHAFVTSRVQSGRYGSASEVVRAALRLLSEREPGHAHHQCPTIAEPTHSHG